MDHGKLCTCIVPVPRSLHDNRCIRCGCPIPEQIMIRYRMLAEEDDRSKDVVAVVALLVFMLFLAVLLMLSR